MNSRIAHYLIAIAILTALSSATAFAQLVQVIDVDPTNEGIELGPSWYDSNANRLIAPGTDYWGGAIAYSAWLYHVNFSDGSHTRATIPPAIAGGGVEARGVSRDGQFVFGWIDTPVSDPAGDGDSFVAPVTDPSNLTFVRFVGHPYFRETRAHDMSANGILVGDAQSNGNGGGFYWTSALGIQAIPVNPPELYAVPRTISNDGMRLAGYSLDPIIGYACTWNRSGSSWEQHILGPTGGVPTLVVRSDSTGYYLGGVHQFNAAAWIDSTFVPILYDGAPFYGGCWAVTDDGFFCGIGEFYDEVNGDEVKGFIWHPTWPEAMTVRDYVLWSSGVDIGRDYYEVFSATSSGGFLYLTGYPAFVLKTPALIAPNCGDINCDCAMNAADVTAFVQALLDPAGFASAYPGCNILHCDMQPDGHVDGGDVQGLVALLIP